jgi:HEAT repeat protein
MALLPFLLGFGHLVGSSTTESLLRQTALHHVVGDHDAALGAALRAVRERPEDLQVFKNYIDALALAGEEKKAIENYRELVSHFGWESDSDGELIEHVAWSSLIAGMQSRSEETRLVSGIAAALTRDARAVGSLLAMLRSSNALHRALALELTSTMRDEPLKTEIRRLVAQEPLRSVRVLAIQAVGELQMVEMRSTLEVIISSEERAADEKEAAIGAMVALLRGVEAAELESLITHPRAGLRQLACDVIGQLELVELVPLVVPRLKDSHPGVRQAAIVTLALLRPAGEQASVKEMKDCLEDADPAVAIAAARYVVAVEQELGLAGLRRHLLSSRSEIARLAAATVAASGGHALSLAREQLQAHPDPFVRANLAIALLNQRCDVQAAAETLASLLKSQTGPWMWDEQKGEGIRLLCPSRVRHEGSMANRPELVNALTRLDILGLLAAVSYPGVQELMREYLVTQQWGISGTAAIALLADGDEAALAIIRQLLHDPDRSIRVQAALALAIWGREPSAVTILQEAYDGADRQLRLRILEALGRIANRDSLPFLLNRLAEPSLILRAAAASVIIQCLNG